MTTLGSGHYTCPALKLGQADQCDTFAAVSAIARQGSAAL